MLGTLLLALSGCASELTATELADLEAEGPYVGEDEAVSSAQALTGVPASTGYLWADQHTATASYAANASYSFNSAGRTNRIDRQELLGEGRYRVIMEGLSAPGNVHVTAYGNNSNRCNLYSAPFNDGGNVSFDVACFTGAGIRVNSQFVVFYNNTGDISGKLAMASVGDTGSTLYRSNIRKVSRQGIGQYRVHIPDLHHSGTPFVTALNVSATFCNPSHHAADLTYDESFVDVRCFDRRGEPTNTAFHFTSISEPNFSMFEHADSFSPSTNDYEPLGYYSSTDSHRAVTFNFENPASLFVRFYSTGVWARTLFLVNAYTNHAVSCKPASWYWIVSDHFETSIVCHDTSGVAQKARVTVGFFGVGP